MKLKQWCSLFGSGFLVTFCLKPGSQYRPVNRFNNGKRVIVLRQVTSLSLTRRSAIAQGLRDALYPLKSFELLHNCTKNHIWKGCNRRLTLKVTQSHGKKCDSIGRISFLLGYYASVVRSNNVSILRVSETLLQRTWLPVTLRSPSVSTRQLKCTPSRPIHFPIRVNICS